MSSSEKLMILADQDETATMSVDKIPFTKLLKSNWTVDVSVASNSATEMKIPRGILHLHVKNSATDKSEVDVLDFTENDLIKFYEVVEQIQTKLDEIYTVKE